MIEHHVQKSFATIREMLIDRGEDLSSMQHMSPSDVAVVASSSPTIFHIDIPSCKFRIIYNLNLSFKLPEIKKLLSVIEEGAPSDVDKGINNIIVVTREKATSTSKKGMEDHIRRCVQFFRISELQFNISRHEFVPKHFAIRNEEEIEKLVLAFRARSRYNFPIISCTDPMARYLALKPGQMVKITRFSPSSGMYTSYRCCSTIPLNLSTAATAK
jgi:DNA-directed RNA polymerase subunit H